VKKQIKLSAQQVRQFLLIVGSGIAMGILLIWGSHRSLIQAEDRVDESWRQIHRVVQRQIDLVPELITMIKAEFPKFQKPMGPLERSHRTLAQQHNALHAPAISQSQLQGYEEAQGEMAVALKRVLGTLPDAVPFKGKAPFQVWLGCYEGTQRLLKEEKGRYNSLAMGYNHLYQRFFVNWVAQRFHLRSRSLFQ